MNMRFQLILVVVSVLCVITGNVVTADETLPFVERNGLKYVTVYINEVPMELVFDTGANRVVLNSDGLLRVGMTEFDDTRKIQSHTAGGLSGGFTVKVNSIRAGGIQKNDYEIAYMPSSTANLLGASFFENYSYYVDEDHKVIRLVPKGSYYFDSVDRPAAEQPQVEQPPSDHHSTGSGRIEVEIGDEKYIYEGGKLRPQDRDAPDISE